MMSVFNSTTILLPNCDLSKWATIACDQHTSEQDYWNSVENIVGDNPSTLRITLPEIYLADNLEKRISSINSTMKKYLDDGLFTAHENSMIYVERTLADGKVRHGIVGVIDLRQYEYTKNSKSLIRSTEETVTERIPPRVKIRKDALLETPHAMLLIDDAKKEIIESLQAEKSCMKKAYGIDLMLGGGHIDGYFIDAERQERIKAALDGLCTGEDPLLFAVGDGNHSLATAKECYRKNPNSYSRYALAEIVNIHDDSLEFEPIYRVLFNVNPQDVLCDMLRYFGNIQFEGGHKITCVFGNETKEISLPRKTKLAVGTLQKYIDNFRKENCSATVDYIHGIEETKALASHNAAFGFIFEGMQKSELFPAVKTDGSLVRKTFSMGHACDKRYYIEARRIKE